MSYQEIIYEARDGVATVTLNRPEKLNAYTRTMGHELRQAMTQATADPDVRAVILTGAGRGFCAGADMALLSGTIQSAGGNGGNGEAGERPPEGPIAGGLDLPRDFARTYSYFPTVPKPVIAAVNGPAAGLGFVLALYADVRFASDEAVFTTSFARRGLIAEHGIDWMLPRIVGLPHALDLLLSARKVPAEEALRMGLVNQVYPMASFMDEVRAYAADLAAMVSPRSMRVMKEQIYRTQFKSLGEAIDIANREMEASFTSEDFREGVAHFVEKRPPTFTGM